MQFTGFVFIPFGAVVFASLGVAIAWPRRRVPGAKAFLLSLAATIEWGVLCTLEILVTDLQLKIVLFDLKAIGIVYSGTFLLISILQYTGRRRWLTRWLRAVLFAVPLCYLIALWTDAWHGAFMRSVHLADSAPYIALQYDHSFLSFTMYSYSYMLTYFTVIILGVSIYGASTVHPWQIASASGVLVLLTVFTPMSILGLNPVYHTDLAPLVMGMGQAAFAAAFFNKRVRGIIPGTRATLYESLRDGIVVLDHNDCIVEVWPSAERILGDQASRLQGHPVNRVLDAAFEPAEGMAGTRQNIVRTKNEGRYIEIETSPLRTRSGDSEGTLMLLYDITERLRSEEQRRNLEMQVQHAQKLDALGRLSGGVAHDFNNLLTIILLNTELARSADDWDIINERLAKVEKASLRAVDLVTQLLAFSRTPQVEMKPIDIGAVLKDMVGVIRETFDRKIEIGARVDPNLPPVLGNKDQMHQVLLNLCINARDAVQLKRWGDGPNRPSITLGAETVAVAQEYCRTNLEASPGDCVRVCVSDNGVGMDAETQQQIFDPFFTTKEVGKGTGLGLAIVYGIVRQHEGWVDVISAPGAGASFYVYLPAMTSAEPEREALDADTLPPRGTGRVLLVDDEELILDAGKTMLQDLGYTPLIASNGHDALRIFEQEKERIVAVILDLAMPQMSGYDVLHEIRQMDPHARVVVASGYSPAGLARPLEALGAAAFVAKPFQIAEIARALRDVIERPL